MPITYKIIICLTILSGIAFAGLESEEIVINAGFMGKVSFSHEVHADVSGNCQKCHSTFPQKRGVIQELKNIQTLQKKHVMKKICISCHKKENAGPTMCYGCHYLIFNFIPSGCLF